MLTWFFIRHPEDYIADEFEIFDQSQQVNNPSPVLMAASSEFH